MLSNIPDKIYLQIEGAEPDSDFNELEVSWCSNRINESDLKYVLAQRAQLLEEALEKIKGWVEDDVKRHAYSCLKIAEKALDNYRNNLK